MTEFVGYTRKQKVQFVFWILLFIFLSLVFLYIGFIEFAKGECSNMKVGGISFAFAMIWMVVFFVKMERSIFYKFKIENNKLIKKKFSKTTSYNLNDLEAIYYRFGSAQISYYLFYFGKKEIVLPYYDNGNEFFKYFFEKKYLEVFNRRLSEIENSKRYYHKDYSNLNRRFLGFSIPFSLFLGVAFFFIGSEMLKDKDFLEFILIVSLLGAVLIYYLVSFIKTHTKKARYAAKNEYIDKDGIHTVEKFIPFSEIVDAERIVNKWFRQDIKLKTKDGEFLIPGKYILNDLFYETYFAQKAVKSSETKL